VKGTGEELENNELEVTKKVEDEQQKEEPIEQI